MDEDIFQIRKKIHDHFLTIFSGNIHNITKYSIPSNLIYSIFKQYDKFFFDEQIENKMKNIKGSLLINITRRKKGSIVIFKIPLEVNQKYIFDISIPLLFAKNIGRYENKIKNLLEVEKMDKIYTIQYVLEHLIIHLIMHLWNYVNMKNDYIYDSYGPLYHCVMKSFFGYKDPEIHRLTSTVSSESEKNNIGLMKNWSQSCYIDSLLLGLLIGSSNVPRDIILRTDVSKIDYDGWDPLEAEKDLEFRDFNNRHFKKICVGQSEINTEKKTRKYTTDLQESIKKDYNNIFYNKETFKCSTTRNILSKCNPDMKNKQGVFMPHPVADLYSSLEDSFPGLKIWNVPVIKNTTDKSGEPGVLEYTDIFTFSQFVFDTNETIGVNINWDIINNPMIAFRNTLAPAFTDYGSVGKEQVSIFEGESHFVELEKHKAFKERIINNRYRLFLVIINHSNRPTVTQQFAEGGSHYNALIRPAFDCENWYKYDDIGPSFKILPNGKLPKNVFIDSNHMRPELMFYEKVKEYIPISKLPKKPFEQIDDDHYLNKIGNRQKFFWKGKNLRFKFMFRDRKYIVAVSVNENNSKEIIISKKLEKIHPKYNKKLKEGNKDYGYGFIWEIDNEKSAKEIVLSLFKNVQKIDLS